MARSICTFEDCGRPIVARGLCNGHYLQSKKGRALSTLIPRVRGGRTGDAFWRFVDKSGNCWRWVGGFSDTGYGAVNVRAPDGRNTVVGAHRVSWESANGRVPDGLFVCHRCDNPWCVRPDHLFLGTNADNLRDAAAKGRTARGERNGRAVLSQGDVVAIRVGLEQGESQTALGRRFGVSHQQVWQIARGLAWQWVA